MPLNNEITLQIGCRPMSTVVSKTIICYKNVWIDLMMPASIYNCFVLIINSKQLRIEQVAALLSEKWILWSPSSCQSLSVPMISKNIGHSPIIPALRWWKYINLSAFVVAVCLCVCVCVSVIEMGECERDIHLDRSFELVQIWNHKSWPERHLSQDRLYKSESPHMA